MTGFKTTTSSELFNSFANMGGAVISEADRLLREKADADLRNMAANYQLAAEEHLLSLERSNDYTNWQDKTEKFLDDQKAIMMQQSKNGYTSRMIDQMLTSYKPSLMATVEKRAWNSQINDVLSEDALTIQTIKNSKSSTPQEIFNGVKSVLDAEYSGGFIDHNRYKASIMAQAEEIMTNHLLSIGNAAIDEAIKNDDKEYLERVIRENGLDFSVSYLDATEANNDTQFQKLNEEKKNYESKIAANNAARKETQTQFEKEWNKIKREEERQKRKSKNQTAEEKETAKNAIEERKWQVKGTYDDSLLKLTNERDALGASFDDYWEQARDAAEDGGSVQLQMMVNQKLIQDNVLKTLDKNYDARLADWQRKNEDQIESHYSNLEKNIIQYISGAGGNLEDILRDINFGAMNVSKNYGGNKLASNKQSQWEDKYRSLLNWYESAIKESKSGSGKVSLPSYNILIDNEPKIAFDMVQNGTCSATEAANAITESVHKQIEDHPYLYKETNGKNAEEVQTEIANNIGDIGGMQILTSSKIMGTNGILNTRYPGVKKTYDNFVSDINKGKLDINADGINYVYETLFKMVANSDIDVKPEVLEEELNKAIDAVRLNKINKLFKKQGMLESNENYIGRLAAETEENDLITTRTRPVNIDYDPTKTREENEEMQREANRVYVPGAKEKLEDVKNELQKTVASAVGIPLNQLKASHQLDTAIEGAKNKNDESSVWLFTDRATNITYKVQPIENKKGKSTGFNVINVTTGEVIKESKDMFNNQAKEAQNQAKQNVKNAENNLNKVEEKLNEKEDTEYNNTNTIPFLVKNALGEKNVNWDDARSRMEYVRSAVTTIDKTAEKVKSQKNKDDFYKRYGISYEDWEKLETLNAKRNYVLNSK